jgi:subtilisin family serine protease
MGDATNIPGKKHICSKSLQECQSMELDGKTLFARYKPVLNNIKKCIDPQYQDFLAYPVEKDESIAFYGKTPEEEKRKFSDLKGEDLEKYAKIKEDTLAHYNAKINFLRSTGKGDTADYLSKAIEHINEDDLYCYDGKVVLGVWGVSPREVADDDGVIRKKVKGRGEKRHDVPEEKEPELSVTPAAVEEPKTDTPEEPKSSFSDINVSERYRYGYGETTTYSGTTVGIGSGTGHGGGYDGGGSGGGGSGVGYGNGKKRRWWHWLLWLLALLLLLLLLWLLKCACLDGHSGTPIPYPISDKPWRGEEPGGKYSAGSPYNPNPTPPGYKGVLPPEAGRLSSRSNPPINRDDPQGPPVIDDVLNILMENEDKSIMDLAKRFKEKYPDSKYKVVYHDDVVKRMQVKVPPAEREALKEEIPKKFVPEYTLFVFDEALFEMKYTPGDPAFKDENKSWYLRAVNAPKAWDITLGVPKLTVAVVDNGFNLNHPELKNKVVMPYNVWTQSSKITPQKVDHGTHVAGTALAIADNGQGLLGIAPKCAFMPVQVADANGIITTTSIADGILYALYQGADVVNVSLGMDLAGLDKAPEELQRDLIRNRFKPEERLWNKVMEIAEKHNATVVVSAGNDNVLAGINPYQRQKNVIVVSATDRNNRPASSQKAEFSNYGEYSVVSAPGVDIYSASGSSGYETMNGTSMAAPIVSGAVALMKSLNESLTSEQIKCILKATGLRTGNDIGELIQIDKALEMVKSGNPAAWPSCAASNPPNEVSACDAKVASGGDEGYLGTFDMQQKSGAFVLAYETYNVPDRITVYDGVGTGGDKIFTFSGGTNGVRNASVNFNDFKVTVEIVSLGNGTKWDFVLNCPNGQNLPGAGGQSPRNLNVPPPANYSGPGGTPPVGNINPPAAPTLPPKDAKDNLRLERERLKRRMEEIDKELQGV